MVARIVRVIKTAVGNGADRLRVVVNLRKDQCERLGLEHGTELEAIDRPDGILLRKVKGA